MQFGGDGNKHNPCLTPTPPQRCASLHFKLCLFPTSPDHNYVYIHTLQIILWPFPNPPFYHFWFNIFSKNIMTISKGLIPNLLLCLFPYGFIQPAFFVTVMAISICRSTGTLLAAARSCTNQQDCRASFLKIPSPNGGEWTAGYKKSGQRSYAFASSDYTKGCYGYTSGKYAGHYFFGTGGRHYQMTNPLVAPKIRTECNPGE